MLVDPEKIGTSFLKIIAVLFILLAVAIFVLFVL